MTKTEKKIKERIEKLSEKRVRKVLTQIAISYVNGAAQQSDSDVAEFVCSDLEGIFRNLSTLVEDFENEVLDSM